MFTINDYLDQLDIDKNTLYDALNEAGEEVESTDTFTVLAPKTEDMVEETMSTLDEVNGEVI